MERDKLAYMANQIARNISARDEEERAIATADHIAMFWSPDMKQAVFAKPPGLDPIAAKAVAMLRDEAQKVHHNRATEFNAVDEVGHSDAG